MRKIYFADQIKDLDKSAISEQKITSFSLIKRAATAARNLLLRRWSEVKKVGIVCGSGNNGADGFVLGALLADRGIQVTIHSPGVPLKKNSEAEIASRLCFERKIKMADIDKTLEKSELIVDALIGTGLSREVEGNHFEVIGKVNESNTPILAIDVPSGLCSDTGRKRGACVRADVTHTYIGEKVGLYTGDGPAYSGEVIFDNLRVPENIYSKTKYAATVLEFKSQKLKVPPRKINSHKGLHGHALIVGGDEGMGGAAIMAAEAALYSGAGLVSLLTHPSNVSAALSRKPEIMVKGLTKTLDLDRLVQVANCVVLGPGLGTGKWGVGLYRKLIKVNKPLVLDADGLNCLASEKDTRDNWILTPHPGEGKRLLGKDCQVDRISSVRELSRRYRATMVLKGPGTLISNSEGDVSLCPYGNPGMAAGGMGDILSGVIGALVAQGVTNYDSAKLGVVLHSFAADEIAREQGKIGLLATDLLLEIRRLLNA